MAARRLHVRMGDLVQVISGADRGKQGKVIGVDASRGRVRVEQVRMQKHHLKPGRKIAKTGGILDREGFIDASNVMLVEPGSGRPSRIRSDRDESGRRVRVFAKTGAKVPEARS